MAGWVRHAHEHRDTTMKSMKQRVTMALCKHLRNTCIFALARSNGSGTSKTHHRDYGPVTIRGGSGSASFLSSNHVPAQAARWQRREASRREEGSDVAIVGQDLAECWSRPINIGGPKHVQAEEDGCSGKGSREGWERRPTRHIGSSGCGLQCWRGGVRAPARGRTLPLPSSNVRPAPRPGRRGGTEERGETRGRSAPSPAGPDGVRRLQTLGGAVRAGLQRREQTPVVSTASCTNRWR